MLKFSLAGTAITALCCFTSLLAVTLAALGLGAAIAWADFVLLPMFGAFLLLTGYALWRRRKTLRSSKPN